MNPTYEGLHRWLDFLNNASLRVLPSRTIINTCPILDHLPRHFDGLSEEENTMSEWEPSAWRDWVDRSEDLSKTYGEAMGFIALHPKDRTPLIEQYTGFYRNFLNLKDLPTLQEVGLHLSPFCLGKNSINYRVRNPRLQVQDSREDILRRFFTSLNARMEDPGNTVVRSLCFRNLQNTKTEITNSDEFKAVMSKVKDLSLLIVEESNPCDSINDIYKEERHTFMPILKHDLLIPVSSHLQSLDLSFHDCWGSLPRKFDSSNLRFPQLRHLSLGLYCLAFNDLLDWILNQTTLEHLSFTSCQIVAYIRVHCIDWLNWHVDGQDWTYLAIEPPEPPYMSAAQYHYPGTWAACFERIRKSLPHLAEFLFRDPRYCEDLKHAGSYGLSTRRYVVLNTDECDGQWVNADSAGNMSDIFFVDQLVPNRHSETMEADGEALAILMKEIERK